MLRLALAGVAAALPAGAAAHLVDGASLLQTAVHLDDDAPAARPGAAGGADASLRLELAGLLADLGGAANVSDGRLQDLLGLVRAFRSGSPAGLCRASQPGGRGGVSLAEVGRPWTLPDDAYVSSRATWISRKDVGPWVFVLAVIACLVVLSLATEWILGIFQTRTWKDGKVVTGSRSFVTLLQAMLPYWTSARRYPLSQFMLHFVSNLIFMLALAYWICHAILYTFAAWQPWLLEGAGIYQSWTVRVLAIIGVAMYPVLWWLTWDGFKDHIRQWWLWTTLMMVEIILCAWVVQSSAIFAKQTDALNAQDAKLYWQAKTLEFLAVINTCVYWYLLLWTRKRLMIDWREHVTHHFISKYLSNRKYYKLEVSGGGSQAWLDNPDERICGDLASFITGFVELVGTVILVLLRAFAFTNVIWNSSPDMALLAVAWAIVVSILVLFMMARLKALKYKNLQAEANFRFSLCHIRSNTEPVAFYGAEREAVAASADRLSTIVDVQRRYVFWMCATNPFKEGCALVGYLAVQVLVGSKFFRGKVDFGTMIQAEIAVNNTLACASLILIRVPLFLDIATDMNRVAALYRKLVDGSAAEQDDGHLAADETIRRTALREGRLELSALTVASPSRAYICKGLCLGGGGPGAAGGPPQQRVIVVGPSGVGKSSLLRAISGLWTKGQGEVRLPEDVMFLPQRPYMPYGTLRDQVTYPDTGSKVDDDELRRWLDEVQLGDLPGRFEGGLAHECWWSTVLSLGEQQRLACLRVVVRRPKVAILDEATAALPEKMESRMYRLLEGLGVAYISVGHRRSLLKHHDRVLQLQGAGAWRECAVGEYLALPAAERD